ncbi:efflux RND transporter periplasmic adaptor subunit [Chitinophaga filiformis]|uniref:Membrane fusion protein, multidrug efflux system n=1 Tax=Chitinophaga filiformis TaxID=104663 RepID=A0A1G7MA36_CHIFI|nr:efflux RND transporter periplasmic adaptor subunit [Chitinophaga filiformis]SDF58040.1 membrane fusion protein, multidrug efflux system [Chitinophaga filiformis]
MRISKRTTVTLLTGISLVQIIACGGKKNNTAKNEVKTYPVMQMAYQQAEIDNDYPATIQGIQNIEIRPKIDGYVEDIYVDEGAAVKKGQLLFRINAPQYQQAVKTAEANIEIARADVNAAQMELNKVKPLVDKDIVSKYAEEAAEYTLQSKQAALTQARAALSNAQTNFSYTSIYSPADGVIGILPYKIGSLISSTTPNPLTTVSNISKIYAYFSINEKQGLDFFATSKGKTMQEKLATLPPVTLVLANGTLLPDKGKVETASGLINTQTGALNMRATFPNPGGLVRSGSSALVRIPEKIDTALLVPQKATYQIQGKLFVYVLGEGNKVRSVEVTSSASAGQAFIITNGIRPGDKIVADGISSLREGLVIKPKPISAADALTAL